MRHENEMRQKYGDQTIKALLYGGARGLTFGLSDQALVKTGIVEQEELQQINERNKGMSVAGEVAGAIAPLLLSGGSSAVGQAAVKAGEKTLIQKIASYAPTKLLAEAGTSSTKATKALIDSFKAADIAKAVDVGADVVGAVNTAKTVADTGKLAKVLEAMTTHGVGAAVEGAAYGVGKLVSEEALGDAEFNGESLAASALGGAKLGALIGGGIGGVASLFEGAGAKAFKEAKKVLLESKDIPVEKRVLLKKMDEEAQIIEAGREALEKAKNVKEAAARQGLETTPGMLSPYREFKDLESHIGTSSYGIGMPSVAKNIDRVYKRAEEATFELLNRPSKSIANSELGGLIKETTVAKIDDALEQSSEMYRQWDEVSNMVEVSQKEIDDIVSEMENHFFAKKVGGQRATREIEQVRNIPNLDELNRVWKQFGKEASAKYLTDPSLAEFYAESRRMFDVAREKAVMRASPQLKKAGINADEFLNMKILADKNHEQIYKDNGFIESLFGIGKPKMRQVLTEEGKIVQELAEESEMMIKGAYEIEKKVSKNIRAFKQKLLEIDPNKLAERILKGSPEDIAKFQQNFPEAFDLIRANKLSDYWQAAKSADGKISTKVLLKRLEKESPEMRKLLGIDEAKFKDIKTVIEQLPADFNPTGSGKVGSILGIFSPTKQLKEAGRFSLYKVGDRALQKQLMELAPTIKAIEATGNKFHESISKGSKFFFKNVVKEAKRGGIKFSVPSGLTSKQLDEIKEVYSKVQTDPNKFTEELIRNNAKVAEHAPKTSTQASKKLYGVAAYLVANAPGRNNQYLNDKYEPPKSALIKFNEKYQACKNPKIVFDHLAQGFVSPNEMDAIKNCYPKMYELFMGKMAENMPKDLNNTQRTAVARALGIQTQASTTQAGLSILQENAQQLQKEGQQQKSRKIDLKRISSNNETSLSRTLNRP